MADSNLSRATNANAEMTIWRRQTELSQQVLVRDPDPERLRRIAAGLQYVIEDTAAGHAIMADRFRQRIIQEKGRLLKVAEIMRRARDLDCRAATSYVFPGKTVEALAKACAEVYGWKSVLWHNCPVGEIVAGWRSLVHDCPTDGGYVRYPESPHALVAATEELTKMGFGDQLEMCRQERANLASVEIVLDLLLTLGITEQLLGGEAADVVHECVRIAGHTISLRCLNQVHGSNPQQERASVALSPAGTIILGSVDTAAREGVGGLLSKYIY